VRLNAPKQTTWLIALVLGVVGVILQYAVTTVDFPLGFVVVLVGLVLLLAANLLPGL
jgi:hypothetical protein